MWIFLTVHVWSFLYENRMNYIKQLNLKGNINIRKELIDTFGVISIQRYIQFMYFLSLHLIIYYFLTLW